MNNKLQSLNYFKQINNLYEIQYMFAKLLDEKKGQGLAKIVQTVTGKKLCKSE